MLGWLLAVSVGWGYWPTNHTIGCGPPYSTSLGIQEYIVSDYYMSGLEVINRYGFMHPPVFPVIDNLVEVMRVVSPQQQGQWVWGEGGFETEIVWFFHAPGSGVWLNLTGRPRVNTFKGKPDTLSNIRAITANKTVVFRAGTGFTEIILRSKTWTTVGTACPDVPFVCKCVQNGFVSACEGSVLVERHGLVCSTPTHELNQRCNWWPGILLLVAICICTLLWCAQGWIKFENRNYSSESTSTMRGLLPEKIRSLFHHRMAPATRAVATTGSIITHSGVPDVSLLGGDADSGGDVNGDGVANSGGIATNSCVHRAERRN